MMRRISIIVLLPLMTAGCVGTAVSIVKAPFQVAGKAVDWTTTSQSESDRNYGRKMRKREAKEGKARRDHDARCRSHADDDDCRQYTGYRASN